MPYLISIVISARRMFSASWVTNVGAAHTHDIYSGALKSRKGDRSCDLAK